MPWKPGESGNPAGRPTGLGDVGRLRAQLAARLPEVIESVIKSALEGDMSAARLIFERVVPPYRAEERPVPVNLNGLSGSRAGMVAVVIQAIEDGELDVHRATRLITALTPSDLEARASRLEAMLHIAEQHDD